MWPQVQQCGFGLVWWGLGLQQGGHSRTVEWVADWLTQDLSNAPIATGLAVPHQPSQVLLGELSSAEWS